MFPYSRVFISGRYLLKASIPSTWHRRSFITQTRSCHYITGRYPYSELIMHIAAGRPVWRVRGNICIYRISPALIESNSKAIMTVYVNI